jgi:hypothetical protein
VSHVIQHQHLLDLECCSMVSRLVSCQVIPYGEHVPGCLAKGAGFGMYDTI